VEINIHYSVTALERRPARPRDRQDGSIAFSTTAFSVRNGVPGLDLFGRLSAPNLILQLILCSTLAKIPRHLLAQCLLSARKTPTGSGDAIQTIARLLGMAMPTSITLSTTFPARQSRIQPAMCYIDAFRSLFTLSALNIAPWCLSIFPVN
jgi:hypothetical protein